MSLTGSVAAFRGQSASAVKAFQRAIEIHARHGDNGSTLLAMFQLAAELLQLGDNDLAAATAHDAITLSERCDEKWGRSYAQWVLARCAWLRGDLDDAWRLARLGLELQRGFRDPVGTGLMIEQLAWIAASRSDFTWAGCLLGTAHSERHSVDIELSAFGPANVDHHHRCELQVRHGLRTAAFQKAFAQGMHHWGQPAIDFALQLPTSSSEIHETPRLTRREAEVAELVGEGLSNRQIASRLGLSPRTVDGHVQRILAKLDLKSRAQIAAWTSAKV